MIRGKVRKELSLILIIMLIAALLTGCSDITDITLKKDGSGSYKEVLTVSKSLWTMASEAYGSDEAVLNMGNLEEKFKSFGCRTVTIDGHDYKRIQDELEHGRDEFPGPPTVIIADTVKGKGISFMENRLEWHFKSPSEEQLKIILEELGE